MKIGRRFLAASLLYHLFGVWFVSVASAQLAPLPLSSTSVSAAADDVAEVLLRGRDLERQHRWGEALTHYEDAWRAHPDRGELEQCLAVTRIRYDLARRYADASYLRTIESISEANATELYNEVLLKVQSHYVTTPDWQSVSRSGVNQLGMALAEPSFVESNLRGVEPARLETFRLHLHQALDAKNIASRQQASELVSQAAQLARRELNMRPQAIWCEFACGALGSLDQYTAFLTPSQLDEVYSQIEGNFVGVGIEIKAENQSLLLVNVLPGSPAERAGLKANERIVEVAGQSTHVVSTDAAADLLRGDPGSEVEVVVLATNGDSRRVRMRRERVEVSSVEKANIADPAYGVAYMKIGSFQKTTSRDVDAALWRLHREGMRTLIIDVRGNPGGLLTASVELADKFLDDGLIVYTRGRSAGEDFDYKAQPVGTWNVPLVVLIDRDSASASEIFAGAIHDRQRGTLIGERSYGKGSVQGIFPLTSARAGVRLTTAKFYSPSGQPISHRGVSPDVVSRRVAKTAVIDNPVQAAADAAARASAPPDDAALATALQLARQRLSQR